MCSLRTKYLRVLVNDAFKRSKKDQGRGAREMFAELKEALVREVQIHFVLEGLVVGQVGQVVGQGGQIVGQGGQVVGQGGQVVGQGGQVVVKKSKTRPVVKKLKTTKEARSRDHLGEANSKKRKIGSREEGHANNTITLSSSPHHGLTRKTETHGYTFRGKDVPFSGSGKWSFFAGAFDEEKRWLVSLGIKISYWHC